MIVVIDFGSQYTQLIARRIRELKVYSEIISCSDDFSALKDKNVEGIILSGGPGSVYDVPTDNYRRILSFGLPTLGICYGMQLAAQILGGKVHRSKTQEYGLAYLTRRKNILFTDVPRHSRVWMSHGDTVVRVPPGARVIGATETTPIAAFHAGHFYGLQFHPEVRHTEYGQQIIDNYLFKICRARKTWSMHRLVDEEVTHIRETVGRDRAICAISGGIDSTVAATIAARAMGKNLIGVFVDNGVLRMNEREEVMENLRTIINLRVVDARARFLSKLRNVRDAEKKRKIIGHEFIRIFEAEARRASNVKYLVQGTLYPDVIESGRGIGPADVIKSHHNVGGLPKKMRLKIIEPLRMLFKDEVRVIAKYLKLPRSFIERKPFPGPGLAVRIVGAVNPLRLRMLRQADRILLEEAHQLEDYQDIWQIFTVLLPLGSVGVMGDKRTYDSVCAIRAVYSDDGMTADWVRLPHAFLNRVARRIVNEVKGINRVVFDITSKPPATIEWE
ncbi:GMP synthase [candidate division WOR_3 bacterium SM23_42]|uniref:GMP synthase [glutamine-hydrolyzing] n=1 Tax=candidate division WOR_3 bacterium SM23_42 TaxID=1703779 RepID=A0A0S8FQC9_UNCW3|nr:MAG: GMP synthase [candidate division WOR_3 bacterium SM23_42]